MSFIDISSQVFPVGIVAMPLPAVAATAYPQLFPVECRLAPLSAATPARLGARLDAVNYCTIGYGHLIALRRCQDTNLSAFGNKLSEADGSKLLEEDTRAARAAVQTLVSVALSDYGYDASDTILLERKDDMRKRGLTARRAATNA
jgi:hypothetical protein